MVSGYATQWYCYRKEDNYKSKLKIYTSFSRLIKYHWGSVAGGSLLLCIFYFVDLFIDFFSVLPLLSLVIGHLSPPRNQQQDHSAALQERSAGTTRLPWPI